MMKYCEYCGKELGSIYREYSVRGKKTCYDCWSRAYKGKRLIHKYSMNSAHNSIETSIIANTKQNSNEPQKSSEDNGFLQWFAMALIIIGIIVSISGIGAIVGIPVAGIGGIGYLIFHLGLASKRNSNFAFGCLLAVIAIIFIVLIVGLSLVFEIT